MSARDEEPDGYASSPCAMHEADPAYMGLSPATDADRRRDIFAWRKAERQRLIAERLAIPSAVRREFGEAIAGGLERLIGAMEGLVVSAYWPFRGEPDLRHFMDVVAARGGRCALPVVVAKSAPLAFRIWKSGDALVRGVWNIPVPAEDAGSVTPDVVIAPVIGFDPGCYRLGYGGGFFDRTLASLPVRPRVLGVGYSAAAIETIRPLPHDIPMDAVITENGPVRPRAEKD